MGVGRVRTDHHHDIALVDRTEVLGAGGGAEGLVEAVTGRRVTDPGAGVDVIVAEARAQQGIGIFLEVRESNQGARALYKKAGFKKMDLRKDYYSDPREDAVIFRLSLLEEACKVNSSVF